MLLFIPKTSFRPQKDSLLNAFQDDGFGNPYQAPMNTYEHAIAFAEEILIFSPSIIYLEH